MTPEQIQWVQTLANEYTLDVRARRQLGDTHAAYHARWPKARAYGVLMREAHLTPKEAIQYFRSVSEEP
jgi:hypothetical protein